MDLLLSVDRAIFLAANQLVGRVDAIDSLALLIVGMPLVKLTVLVALFWGIWFAAPHDDRKHRGTMLRSAFGVLVAMLAARLLQNLLPHRARPINAGLPGLRHPAGTDLERIAGLADWSSMPSDHAVVAFALATTIYLHSKRLGWFAFIWSAVVICLPRVHLGRHYPGDILVGAAIGIGIVGLTARWHLLNPACRGALRLEAAQPVAFYFMAFIMSQQLASLFDDLRRIGSTLGRALRAAGLG